MVIKNNQTFLDLALLVAMKYAVGMPNMAVSTVVKNESFIDRQKISKCASAQTKLSSNISRSSMTLYQFSVVKIHLTPV